MKSSGALLRGILLAFVLGLLAYAGILGPLFATFLSTEVAQKMSFPAGILVFGFAFYFGGMISGYHATANRRLHGVAVVLVSFGVAFSINLLTALFLQTGNDPLANFRGTGSLIFTALAFGVSLGAAYVGARRGEQLYAYNLRVSRAWKQKKDRSNEPERPS